MKKKITNKLLFVVAGVVIYHALGVLLGYMTIEQAIQSLMKVLDSLNTLN